MTGFTDRVSKGILDHITGKSALFSIPTAYVALFTAAGVDAGTGFTEVSGGSYARAATAASDWNSASGSSPSSTSNANTITFPTATADWGDVVAFGLYDASSAGNLMCWDYFGNFAWQPCTISAASPGVFTAHAHGFSAADLIEFTTEYGGTSPTFSQSNLTGALTVVSPTTDTFTVTNGATAVNMSATGNGMVRKLTKQTISNGNQPAFPASALNIMSS
jgi:hypothetical protein